MPILCVCTLRWPEWFHHCRPSSGNAIVQRCTNVLLQFWTNPKKKFHTHLERFRICRHEALRCLAWQRWGQQSKRSPLFDKKFKDCFFFVLFRLPAVLMSSTMVVLAKLELFWFFERKKKAFRWKATFRKSRCQRRRSIPARKTWS